MDNKIIHQTLAEIEESLANIESARTQINNVSKKSEDLVFEFSKILRQLDIVEKEKLFDGSEFRKKVDDSYVKFNKKIELTNEDFTNQYEVVSDQFKKEIYSILEKLQILENDLDKLNKTIVNTEKKASSFDFKSALKDLTSEVNSKIERFEINQYSQNKNINVEIEKGFKNTLSKIHEIDPSLSYKDLKNSISDSTMKVIKMEIEIDKGFKHTLKKIHEIDSNDTLRELNNNISENRMKIERIETKIGKDIESLKLEFESKFNSSISGLKRTLILMHIGTFGLFGFALLGVILKWLRYI